MIVYERLDMYNFKLSQQNVDLVFKTTLLVTFWYQKQK